MTPPLPQVEGSGAYRLFQRLIIETINHNNAIAPAPTAADIASRQSAVRSGLIHVQLWLWWTFPAHARAKNIKNPKLLPSIIIRRLCKCKWTERRFRSALLQVKLTLWGQGFSEATRCQRCSEKLKWKHSCKDVIYLFTREVSLTRLGSARITVTCVDNCYVTNTFSFCAKMNYVENFTFVCENITKL